MKHQKGIRNLTIATGLLCAVFLNMLVLSIFNGGLLSWSEAYEVVSFDQRIAPFNPIDNVENIQQDDLNRENKLLIKNFRVISNLDADLGYLQNEKIEKVTEKITTPVAVFSGKALYPNSEILLEINSIKFFVSVRSDSMGNWSWSNLGHPLENGTHTIEMYNISPFKISEKRDVYADKFSFLVDDSKSGIEKIELVSSGYKEKLGDGDTGDLFLENNVANVYFFELMIPNERLYFAGEEIPVQLLFSDIGSGFPMEGLIKYDLMYLKNGSFEKVMDFQDKVMFSGNDSFLKKIKLKDRMLEGEYLLKVSAETAGRTYVQSVNLNVSDKKVVQVGEVFVTREKLNKVLVCNVLVVLGFLIVLLLVVIYEYGRYFVYGEIDEDIFKRKGFFK